MGDWLLLDPDSRRPQRLLPRLSLFRRRAPGTGRDVQLIAANVDTLFVLSSCNEDFSPARLERYLALARAALPLMERRGGGSIVTLTYLGSERVFPNYNVMGVAKAALEASVRYLAADLGGKNIRVNAISAGPIKTLAAAGISGFSSILQVYRDRAPLRRNVETAEVADAALFLLGAESRAVTGEILVVVRTSHNQRN